MKRDNWIDEVLKPWKAGDVLECRNSDVDRWLEAANPHDDPINHSPHRSIDYRLKPREAEYMVKIPEDKDDTCFRNLAYWMKAQSAPGFSDWLIKAIRAAKPLTKETKT